MATASLSPTTLTFGRAAQLSSGSCPPSSIEASKLYKNPKLPLPLSSQRNGIEPKGFCACQPVPDRFPSFGSPREPSFFNNAPSKSKSRTWAVRAQQDQKEREKPKEETSRTIQNLLNELRDKGGVEAAKKGAEIAKGEAKKDLNWYRSLNKPWFAPPEPVYGLAWTGLYAAMAAATWIVVTEGGGVEKQAVPLAVFAVQLYLNFQWPKLFFVDKQIAKAQIDNLFLLASLVLTYQLYRNVSPTAGQLIFPSIIWVAFANVLNYVILQQNQDA